MFEKCLGSLPPPPVTEDEIAGEYEEWELENDLALEVIDQAVIDLCKCRYDTRSNRPHPATKWRTRLPRSSCN